MSLCPQYDIGEYSGGPEFWWILTKGFWEFLKSIHDGTTCASKLRGYQHIRCAIFEYLKPKGVLTIHDITESCTATYTFCTFIPCAYLNCEFSECIEHGWGDKYSHSDEYVTHECLDCDKHYCWLHDESEGISKCDVCTNLDAAEQSLGCYDRTGPNLLCPDHPPVRCTKLVRDSEDCCGESDNDEVCGFNCCSSCLEDHRCGDDPSEYC